MNSLVKVRGRSSRRNRKCARDYDKELYKARHLIENLWAKLKQYRAIATRYDKRAINFLGTIYLAAAVIWLNWWHALV
jgi:transposase